MRARLFFALFLLCISSLAQAQDLEPAWLEVADVNLRLRSGPSTDDDVITRLTPREAVELLERGEAWSHIRRRDGTTGWAANDYLLPWDERNRPDARRRFGERRLFRVQDEVGQRHVIVNAELRAISEHSYIYTFARSSDELLPTDQALQRLGELFDGRIYRQALDLWGIDDPPDIGGDERVVIVFIAGPATTAVSNHRASTTGRYHTPRSMPGETDPHGAGFISIQLSGGELDMLTADSDAIGLALSVHLKLLAHEFGHMLHDHVGGNNRILWVSEGLAEFTAVWLEHEQGLFEGREPWRVTGDLTLPADIQLNKGRNYPAGIYFMIYIHERLGLQALRDFAAHPQQGLDALDALLDELNTGINANDFFADWVLANNILDARPEGGRYGYVSPQLNFRLPPRPVSHVKQLPAALRKAAAPYTADYYELNPLLAAGADQWLLDFRLATPAPQDAWLQLVQVLPERIDVQRFRASDYRNQPVLASLEQQPLRIFVAISPFTPGARRRTRPVNYSLAIRQQPSQESPQAQVTTTLNLRSNPVIGDNVLGRLTPCSLVLVLQRGPLWSQVQNDKGLIGWSHNDYLFHLTAPSPGAPANSCAALTRAAHDGDLGEVRRLLANGVPVNGADAFGRTALHEAALWGHDEVLARLLRAGADAHAQDVAGRNPLDDALRSGHGRSARLLQEAGAGRGLADPTLMLKAAAEGNEGLLKLVLAEGHDVNWRDANGRTALAAAAARGQFTTLQLLLAAGASAQQVDDGGRSALMLAAADGHNGALQLLLAANAQVNQVDRQGHTALTLAAANGHALSVAMLLSGEADVHHTLPASGRNALHLAAAAGYEDVVAMLMLAGTDIQRTDAEGHSARQLAETAGHERARRYLRMADPAHAQPRAGLTEAELAELFAAARRGDLAETEGVLAAATTPGWRGNPLLAADEEGLTALMLAARAGHRDVALRLLLAGAKPDIRANIGLDESALYFTIQAGFDDLSAMLLLAGATPVADPGARPRTTALMWAAESGREDVAHLLLNLRGSQHIDVNERAPSGWTPLVPAVFSGHVNVVRILLASGADPNARVNNIPLLGSASLLEIARANGDRAIIDMLLAAGAQA